MIIKNINGISYWKINSFSVSSKIEVALHGYLNENDEQYLKLFTIDIPIDIINNLLLIDYNSTIEILENWIVSNVQEFIQN
jgi:hypothetical protein